jgi:hypothetical protein
VSKGSHAEKLGIRVGDVVECLNGERICNTFEVGVLSLYHVRFYGGIYHIYVALLFYTKLLFSCCYQLENILLSTCEGHLERGNAYNSKVDIVVFYFMSLLSFMNL